MALNVVMRVAPIRRGRIKAVAQHNHRLGELPDHVDPSRTHLNRFWLSNDTEKAIKEDISGIKMARREKNADLENVAAEVILSATPRFFEDSKNLDRWIDSSLTWLREEFKYRLLSVVLHLDEETPHMHAVVSVVCDSARINPKTKEKMAARPRINYSQIFFDRRDDLQAARNAGRSHIDTKLGRLQTRAAKAYVHLGLERGKCSARSENPSLICILPGEWRQIQEEKKEIQRLLKAERTAIEAARAEKFRVQQELNNLGGQLNQAKGKAQVELNAYLASAEAKKKKIDEALKKEFENARAERDAFLKSMDAEKKTASADFQSRKGAAQAEIDKLVGYVNDGKKLLASMKVEYQEAKDELEKVKAELHDAKMDSICLRHSNEGIQAELEKGRAELAKVKAAFNQVREIPTWKILDHLLRSFHKNEADRANEIAFFLLEVPDWISSRILKTAPDDYRKRIEAWLPEERAERAAKKEAEKLASQTVKRSSISMDMSR